jgi:hypothetical protein
MRGRLFLLSVVFMVTCLEPVLALPDSYSEVEIQDTIGRQILYNGRAWRNLYYRIKGDQFLFTTDFIPGSVTIDGKIFEDLPLKYDIYSDELILLTDNGITIQLNKEMIERFTLSYLDRLYIFKKLETDSVNSLSGYVNVLCEGSTSLYVRYIKEILLLAVDNRYDLFNQLNKIYLEKEGVIEQVNNRRQLLKLIADQKQNIHTFIKSNKIHLSRKNPDAYIPVIEYYNKLTN